MQGPALPVHNCIYQANKKKQGRTHTETKRVANDVGWISYYEMQQTMKKYK